MIAAVLAVLACTAVLALAGPAVARSVHPATATRLLVPVGLAAAMASAFALAVAAFTLVGQLPEIAEMGEWSPAALRADTPVPAVAAMCGALLLAYALGSTLLLVWRRSVALLAVHRSCGRLGDPGALVVVESDAPDAFTTPEVNGRIIVTRGMLNALTPAQRRAMLAHEASHLRHRHTWWLLAADLAAAINPALRPTARALRQTVERWADEDAAAAVADRETVAYAVAHAALAAHTYRYRPGTAAAAAATGGDVPARVAALLVPRAPGARGVIVALAISLMVVAGTVFSTLAVERSGETLFEKAMGADGRLVHAVVATHGVDTGRRAHR
ncbi:MAG TPA: M48 family metalloprotease [Micromonosporaceae bacterium]|nr:M48 family metalloprotease [Micromonosporaceae bacterium]